MGTEGDFATPGASDDTGSMTPDEWEAISKRAFELHDARGRPNGDDFGDWFEAERQLTDEGVIRAKPGVRQATAIGE